MYYLGVNFKFAKLRPLLYAIVDLTPPNLSVFTTAETLRVDPTSYYQISQTKLEVFIFVIFYIVPN